MLFLDYLYNLLQIRTENKFYYLSLIKEKDGRFSIHGLWPQYSINSYPKFCKQVKFDINELKDIYSDLNKYWYSNRNNNDDFWQHEYKKHGSCVFVEMTEKQYFEKTLELYKNAIKLKLPEKFYDEKTNKCLIPLNLNFEFV